MRNGRRKPAWYKVTPNVSLFIIARSFMPRSSIASYIGELPPEESTSYEVGAKFDLLEGITANIALFDIHKRNVLYTESIGDETVAKPRARCVPRAWKWIWRGP